MRRLPLVLLLMSLLMLLGASSAMAASPAWRLLAATGPTHLPPVQSEIQEVAVDATGGTFTLTPTTGVGTGTLSAAAGLGNVTSGSAEVLVLFTSGGAFQVGQTIGGAGIPPGTTITGVAGGTLTLSAPATATASFTSLSAGSTEVSGVSASLGSFNAGDAISGTGIPVGTTIVSTGAGTLTLSQPATAPGSQTLTATETTAPIVFDAEAEGANSVAAALEDLHAFGVESVSVAGGPGNAGADSPYAVTFGGAYADTDVAEVGADGSGLTGGGGTVAVSTALEGGPGTGELGVYLTNVGGMASVGTTTVTIGPLPAGITTSGAATGIAWSCTPSGAGQSTVTCARASSVPALATTNEITVPLEVGAGAPLESTFPVTVEGGGAAGQDTYSVETAVSTAPSPAGIQAMWAGAFDENGASATQAGGHPNGAGTGFLVNTNRNSFGDPIPAGDPRDVAVDLPPGFVGNPMITARCPRTQTIEPSNGSPDGACTAAGSALGDSVPLTQTFPPAANPVTEPVFNSVPPRGYAAQLTFKVITARVAVLASLRSDEDYGVTTTAPSVPPNPYKVFGSFVMLEGSPAAAGGKSFLTNPTDCAHQAASAPTTTITANSWQQPSLYDSLTVGIPPVVGCEELDFEPEFAFQPSATTGSTPVATEAKLTIDQSRLLEPDELAPPHLKRSVVTLPEGLNLNPAAAGGLEACSTDQMGYRGGDFPAPNPTRFDEDPVGCPDASKVGVAEVKSPLLDDPLHGTVYLGAQGDNPFGSLISLYIVVEDEQTGITLKLPGKVTPNRATGQLTAEFDNNPQAPFEELKLKFRGGGPRSTLATPDVCGRYETKGSWTPWSAPESGPPAPTTDSFEISGNCAPAKAQRPFELGFAAGTTAPLAGQHSPFTLQITRPDGNQEIDRVTVATPPGFAATLKGVAICPDAGIAQALARSNPGDGKTELASPSCPAASQIGTTTVGAGVGPEPIYVDTGRAYLAGPYRGAPLSLTFVVPAVAGPFDLGVQVVRTALRIDPRTAQITAESDPIPQMLQGIPLQIRDIRVAIDRPGFSLNPTNCETMSVAGQVTGGSGAVANLSNRFQVGNCRTLGFKPRMNLRLFGGTKRAKYQGLRAVVRPRPGDANIGRTVVRMPRSAFLAQEHIRTVCTRVQFAADACPQGAVYGKAIAYSPLLDYPLRGDVYLRSSDNKLPDLVADLRGPAHQPIRVELVGRTDSVKGALRNTFDTVPDAPVSYFRLQLFGGKKGLIVNSRDICRGKNRAAVRMDAQNGRGALLRPPLFNKRCAKQAQVKRRSEHRAK